MERSGGGRLLAVVGFWLPCCFLAALAEPGRTGPDRTGLVGPGLGCRRESSSVIFSVKRILREKTCFRERIFFVETAKKCFPAENILSANKKVFRPRGHFYLGLSLVE